MNPDFIKEELKEKIGKKVKIIAYGMRNKSSEYEGIINALYPNIFTIKYGNSEKSFNYRDIITGDIKIKYK